jgi:hypothetical protein
VEKSLERREKRVVTQKAQHKPTRMLNRCLREVN